MRRSFQGAALLAAAAFVWPLLAQDKAPEKKDAPEPKKEEKEEEKKESPYKSAGAPRLAKLVQIDESKKHLKIKIEEQVLNEGEQQALLQAQADLQRAQLERNPQQRAQNIQNALNRIAEHKAKLTKIELKDAEVDCLEDVKVRLSNPPAKFNEKGDIVKPTKQELEELKGPDKSLPGYTGEFSDLRTDQLVQLSLEGRKEGPPELKNKKPNERTAEAQAMIDKRYVSIIYVIEAPQSGPPR